MAQPRRPYYLIGFLVVPVIGLALAAGLCAAGAWGVRAASAVNLNARVCLERTYTNSSWPAVFSIGTYFRAGHQPLPPPIMTSYRMCVYTPWLPGIPTQAAFALPQWLYPQ
jgi:hypothetical protein